MPPQSERYKRERRKRNNLPNPHMTHFHCNNTTINRVTNLLHYLTLSNYSIITGIMLTVKIMAPISFNNDRTVYHKVRGGESSSLSSCNSIFYINRFKVVLPLSWGTCGGQILEKKCKTILTGSNTTVYPHTM